MQQQLVKQQVVKQQFEAMLTLQDRMNTKVHPHWIEQNFEWFRALWIECGELVEHYGYKWWKKQTPDMEQVKLEVVDIWHFGLSMLFDGRRDIEQIATDLCAELEANTIVDMGVREATEALAGDVLSKRQFSVSLFWSLLQSVDMDLAALYKAYVGKNILNFFRQDNGYKDGSYIKNWAGREDNEHLVELLETLDSNASDFSQQLYAALQQRYVEFNKERT